MGKLTETKAEQQWIDLCNQQGWNEFVQTVHLEGFIRANQLFTRFVAYVKDAAQEELNDPS